MTGQGAGVAKDAADGARGTASTVARLPLTRVVSGRERCPAAGGGPDCRAATDALCRGKGYSSGTSVDVQSAQKCPAWVWLSGRSSSAESECTTETFVMRAVCQ